MTSGVERGKDEIDNLKKKVVEGMRADALTFIDACEKAGVSRSEAYTWREADADFEESVLAARLIGNETRCDKAEKSLDKMLEADNERAVFYTLTRLGKNRGYAPKVINENTGPGGSPMSAPSITIELVDSNYVPIPEDLDPDAADPDVEP